MSQWTHIAGSIRVDGISHRIEDNKKIMVSPLDLGIETIREDFDYNASEEEKDAYYKRSSEMWTRAEQSGIPMGSEGSLHYQWVPKEDDGSVNCGQYLIWGDLRDFDNVDVIYDWLKKAMEKAELNHVWLRQVAVQVWVEGKPPMFIGLEFDEQKKQEVLVKYEGTANGALLYAK